jgi:hypothetical protein
MLRLILPSQAGVDRAGIIPRTSFKVEAIKSPPLCQLVLDIGRKDVRLNALSMKLASVAAKVNEGSGTADGLGSVVPEICMAPQSGGLTGGRTPPFQMRSPQRSMGTMAAFIFWARVRRLFRSIREVYIVLVVTTITAIGLYIMKEASAATPAPFNWARLSLLALDDRRVYCAYRNLEDPDRVQA